MKRPLDRALLPTRSPPNRLPSTARATVARLFPSLLPRAFCPSLASEAFQQFFGPLLPLVARFVRLFPDGVWRLLPILRLRFVSPRRCRSAGAAPRSQETAQRSGSGLFHDALNCILH